MNEGSAADLLAATRALKPDMKDLYRRWSARRGAIVWSTTTSVPGKRLSIPAWNALTILINLVNNIVMEETILDLIYFAHCRLAALENTPRDYGTGELLFSSDIHTVVAIGSHVGCNLTELAVNLGVSNPAAFKFATKMVRLGYLIKERRDGNRKEVVFSLSKKGRQATMAHAAFERRTFGPLQELERKLTVDDKKVILDFLDRLNQSCAW
ncbi:MAG: hypothetical protein A2Y36_15705 [Treponema sp. GWA1_62_8]|nr:MAG: hypothetical protein A2Y36_15705 [Treponema sp. GWA1_62_8]